MFGPCLYTLPTKNVNTEVLHGTVITPLHVKTTDQWTPDTQHVKTTDQWTPDTQQHITYINKEDIAVTER